MSISTINAGSERDLASADRHRRWRITAGERVLAAAGAAEHGVEWPLEPKLTARAERVPEGDDWLHEIKPGGCRILARVNARSEAQLLCEGKGCTERLPSLVESLSRLPVASAILDGELVTTEQGLPELRIFDLLALEGFDLRSVPLFRRKQLLAALLEAEQPGPLRYVDHVLGCGSAAFEVACALGAEGVVSRRVDSRYCSGTGEDWLETRCYRWEELEGSPIQLASRSQSWSTSPAREMALRI